MNIFTNNALQNIKKTGNVWGVSLDYVLNREVKLPFRWLCNITWRRAGSFMGRFGGGWKYKLGITIGGTTVLVDLFIMSFRFSRKEESK